MLCRIALQLLSAFKDTDFSLAARAANLCSHENSYFVQLLQLWLSKKIMFQCQVYKQHPCSIMFKEIIPTRGCSSLLNKSLSRICVLTFLFLGMLCSFLLGFVRSITVLQIQSPCPK